MPRLNLFDPEVRANPYPHYAELRRSAPVTPVDPGGFFAVSRYDDVVSVMKNPTVFSSAGLRPAALQPWLEKNPIADSLVFLDPPKHTGIRALVTHAFSTRVLPRVEPIAREVSREFAERAQTGVELDICEELSLTLPASIIANLLGLDRAKLPKFRAWSEDLVSVSPATPEEVQPRIRATIEELTGLVTATFEARRRKRENDLASDLLDAEVEGRKFEQDELVSFMFLLFTAGFETTAHLLAHATRILEGRPELIARMQANPASIPDFVEEVLRYEPSVHGTLRVTTADTEIAGVSLPAGSPLILLLASANRDESHFEEADRFDMGRKRRVNLSFGHGIHVCLGASLARFEARVALEELLPKIKGVRVTQKPEWNMSLTVRGPRSLGVVFQPV